MNSRMRAMVGIASVFELLANAQNRRRPGVDQPSPSRNIRAAVTPIDVPSSLAELVALSPVVIVGACQGEFPSRFFVKGDPRTDVVTDRIVRVDRVLKGTVLTNTQIAIQELGGSLSLYDGVHSINQAIIHQRPLQQQRRYLLFLRPAGQVVNDAFDGHRFSVTGIWAGSFELTNGGATISDGAEAGIRQLGGLSEAELLARVRDAIAATPNH